MAVTIKFGSLKMVEENENKNKVDKKSERIVMYIITLTFAAPFRMQVFFFISHALA